MTQPTDGTEVTQGPEAAEQTKAADEGTEYLEYKGDAMYGTEFLLSHTITPAQAKAAEWDSVPEKDMVWTRRASGKHKGRMLLKVADLTPGVVEELVTDPAFRVVKLK
jgi:hypothetical protein